MSAQSRQSPGDKLTCNMKKHSSIADEKVKAGDKGLEPQISARGMDPRESSHHERHAAQQHTDISLERQHKYDSMAASAASTVRQLAQQSMSDAEQKRCLACF